MTTAIHHPASEHQDGKPMPPLHGIRVIELANVISGPYAAMVLLDLGADVIKVELPGTGDPFRRWDARSRESSDAFKSINRGKRSVAVDIRTEAGQRAVVRLIESADVLIKNFRPGFLDALGLGYGDLMQHNLRLVYCSIRGMNDSDQRPVYDAIAQARSGLWSQFTDMTRPTPSGPALADHLAGMQGALAVLAALVQRSRTDRGAHVTATMLGACVSIQEIAFANYFSSGEVADRMSRVRASQSHGFVCADGLPIAIHLSSVSKFWTSLVSALGVPELADDERFASPAARREHYEELHDVLSRVFVTEPRQVWLERLTAADVPVAPILTVAEATEDELVTSLDLFHRFGSGERAFTGVGSPIAGFAAPDRSAAVPWVGEHTEAVLAEVGIDRQAVASGGAGAAVGGQE